MSSLRLRGLLRRSRRHAALVAVILVAGGAIAAHHSGTAIGASHDGMDLGAMAEMCLGAFTAIGTVVAAVAIGLWALGRWRPAAQLSPVGSGWAPGPPQPRARAGPSLLSLLGVLRR